MPTYLEPIGVPQWAEGEKPKREQFNKVFEDLNTAYAGISTDAVQRAETAAASAKQNAQGAAASAEQARQIAANTEVQYQVREDQVGFKRPADKDYTWTGPLTGPQGPTGRPLHIAGHFDTLDALSAAYPAGDGENAYLVGGNVCVFADGAWREIGVDVTASDVPTAAGQTVQQELDGLHTGIWDAFNVLSDVPKSYAASRPCVLRPSFAGRTVQDGTPSPDSPAPIKGVLNPWARAYTGEPVKIDTRVPVNAAVADLQRLPNGTCDQVAHKDGQWGIERITDLQVLSITEDWAKEGAAWDGTQTITFYHPSIPHTDAEDSNFICNRFKAYKRSELSTSDIEGCCFGGYGSDLEVKILKSRLPGYNDALSDGEKVALFKTWLTANPLSILYRKDNATFEPIPAWNIYGKINPITATTTITKPKPDAPISPDNIATITGTPVVTTGYRGVVKQLVGEAFAGDGFDGVDLNLKIKKIVFDGTENWYNGGANNDYYVVLGYSWSPTANEKLASNYFVPADSWENLKTTPGTMIVNLGDGNLCVNYDNAAGGSDNFKAKLAEWAAAGQPLEVVYELATPTITRHDLDIPLTSGDWTVECGDDNGLLNSMDITVFPDPNTYGNRIYPYTHTKVGNVHQLTGTPGAAEISFAATATYGDGDTWTINGAPVAATYADGQKLLPTAVIAGETVRAVLERKAVKHIEGVIMPGENLLQNGDFRKSSNNTDHWNTVSTATLTPYSGYVILSNTDTGNDPSITQPIEHLPLKKGEPIKIAILCERIGESPYGTTGNVWTGQSWGWVNWGNADPGTYYPEIGRMQTFTTTCVLDHDVGPGAYFTIGCRGTTMKIYAVKLEIGPRFTGWNAPLFDALQLLMDKPTPQKNLLDNADLRKPVNQRELTIYQGPGYTIDRWFLWNAETSITLKDGYIELSPTGNAGESALVQFIGSQITRAGTYTFTAEVEGHVGMDYWDDDTHAHRVYAGESGKKATVSFTYTIDHDVKNRGNRVSLVNSNQTESIKIYRVQLEPGPRFTGWDSPKPAETLAECQRHQYSVVSNDWGGLRDISTAGIAYSATFAVFPIPIPEMRVAPTLIVSGISKLRLHGMFSGIYRNDIIPQAIWVQNASKKNFSVRIDIDPNTPYTVGNVYGLYSVDGGVSIILDANIY